MSHQNINKKKLDKIYESKMNENIDAKGSNSKIIEKDIKTEKKSKKRKKKKKKMKKGLKKFDEIEIKEAKQTKFSLGQINMQKCINKQQGL